MDTYQPEKKRVLKRLIQFMYYSGTGRRNIVRTDITLENSKIHRSSSGYARPQSTVTSNADNHLQNEQPK